MPLKYHENNDWKALLPILEEHAVWFRSMVQYVFYPVESLDSITVQKPTAFTQWVVDVNRRGGVELEITEKLTALNQDLFKNADVLVQSARESGARPEWVEFKNFVTLYEEFMHNLRRLENDLVVEGSGYDAFTGLRSQAMFIPDIERELHRLARQGKSFCVALVSINNFDKISAILSPEEADGCIKLLAGLIKVSIRSFDDAYYLGKNEFILCLKQAEISGGVIALERLKRELEAQKITFTAPDGDSVSLSMSCCIAEPVCEDDASAMIDNLRADLKGTRDDDSDAVLKYHELSPLQRFVQQGNK